MKSIYQITNPSLIMIGIVIMLFFLETGCSNNPPGPPDLTLTYEVVSKDPAKYKGKRVKWYGRCGSGSFEKKGAGTSVKDAVFLDPTTDFRVTVRAFSADGESEMEFGSFRSYLLSKPCWVIGTVAGTHKIHLEGSQSIDMEVPVLHDAQFE